MSNIMKSSLCPQIKLISRMFSCSSSLGTKKWREDRGLPANRTAEGVLTDAPDYTFLDGRPTPLLHKQKQRMLKQQNYASQIVQLSEELLFAKERYWNIRKTEEAEKQRIIADRLKPKGKALDKRK